MDPNGLSHPFVPDILEEDSARVWVATYNGLNLLDVKTGRSKHFTSRKNDPNSLSNNVVMCLFKDFTGNLWVGTDKGVNKLNLNAKAFRSIHPDTDNNASANITCLIPASNHKWIMVGVQRRRPELLTY